ncbi:MAG: nodulation protein NfeD [Reinekea sp.]
MYTPIRLNIVLLTTLSCLLLVGSAVSNAGDHQGPVLHLTINGAITPATDDYFSRGLEKAGSLDATVVLLQLDTPGGLDTSMRSMIKAILNSAIPVVTYVGPSGARAASAGTYLLYASHVAAMAPGTNLGAATPVNIGGLSASKPPDSGDDSAPQTPSSQDAMRHKVVNDAVAYIRSLAQLRGRNEQWAEQAVRASVSLSAEDALTLGVIDLVAEDINDLLNQLDGREMVVQQQKIRIHTAEAIVQTYEPDWRNRLLAVITDPNVAYILMLIGVYGLIMEFVHPGTAIPGTVGAISLLLALYAFQLLPVNYAGMALMFLGIGLMVGEAFQPSFGILGMGGVVAFVVGSIILIDTDQAGLGIDLSVILIFAVASVLMFLLLIGLALRARRRPVVSGMEELIGQWASVCEDFDQQGRVRVHSEYWTAITDQPLKKDESVQVMDIHGLVLTVAPAANPHKEDRS